MSQMKKVRSSQACTCRSLIKVFAFSVQTHDTEQWKNIYIVWQTSMCTRLINVVDVCYGSVTTEPQRKISNIMVCATSKASDQSAHTHSLIRAFASRLNILWMLSYWLNTIWSFLALKMLHMLVCVYTCQNATLLEITFRGSTRDFGDYRIWPNASNKRQCLRIQWS